MAFNFSLDEAVKDAQDKDNEGFKDAIGKILMNLGDHADDKSVSRARRRQYFTGIENLTGWTLQEQMDFFQSGRLPATQTPAALDAGSTPAEPAAPAASQVPADYEQVKADATALIEFLNGLISKKVVDSFDFGNPLERAKVIDQIDGMQSFIVSLIAKKVIKDFDPGNHLQRQFVIDQIVEMKQYADRYKESQGQGQGQPQTSPSQADLNAANRRIQELETALANAKTAVNAADTLLSKADAVVAPRGGWTFVDGRKSVKVPPNGWLYNDDAAGKLVDAIESAKETLKKY